MAGFHCDYACSIKEAGVPTEVECQIKQTLKLLQIRFAKNMAGSGVNGTVLP